MTSLGTDRHNHNRHSDIDEFDRTDDVRFSLCEYDFDVVNDALANPDRNEYLDHFGFQVQVKIDDENEDSSDSEFSDDDSNNKEKSKPDTATAATLVRDGPTTGIPVRNKSNKQQEVLSSSKPSIHSDMSSSTASTSGEDDDTDRSVDTAMTTPTVHKIETISSVVEDYHHIHQSRSATVFKSGAAQTPLPPLPPIVSTQHQHQQTQTTRRGRVTPVSRPSEPPPVTPAAADHFTPLVQEGIRQQETMTGPKSTFGNKFSETDIMRTQSPTSYDYSSSISSGRVSTSRRSFSPFKRSDSPSSTRSHNVERPSQAFRERQSKRMSEVYTYLSAPSSLPNRPTRISMASGGSYYDMLMSKFGRPSEEQVPRLPRELPKHTALKDEARACIEAHKDEMPEVDWEFWLSMVNSTDTVVRLQPDLVKQRLVQGIPSVLRGHMWQILARSRNQAVDLDSEYKELLKRISPHEKSILRDLARTFPSHEFFRERDGKGQEALFSVIKAYSLFDPEVGYCQGLPFLVGCLLLHLPDNMAFGVLVKLMSHYGLRAQFMTQMELLHERLYQFDHLLQQKLPKLSQHLEAQGVQPSMYASQWFLTLFASRAPFHLVFRVLDIVLAEGTHAVLRFALALMFRNQHTLMGLEFDELVDFLNNSVYDTYKDDPRGFVNDQYKMDISTKLLMRLAKQYAAEAAREAKTQSQEEHLRKVNMELSGHVRRLEKAYHQLEKEHNEVTEQVIDAKVNVAQLDGERQQLRWELAQTNTELEQLRSRIPNVEQLQKQNKRLTFHSNHLENQVTDMEAVLISLKVKYAESEGNYEMIRQKLHRAGAL